MEKFKEILVTIGRKMGSRKFLLALLPILNAVAQWAATGAPPEGSTLYAAIAAIIAYIASEAYVDGKAVVRRGINRGRSVAAPPPKKE